ncbi:hypothetical protein D3C72_2108600 [compost metagenome]
MQLLLAEDAGLARQLRRILVEHQLVPGLAIERWSLARQLLQHRHVAARERIIERRREDAGREKLLEERMHGACGGVNEGNATADAGDCQFIKCDLRTRTPPGQRGHRGQPDAPIFFPFKSKT